MSLPNLSNLVLNGTTDCVVCTDFSSTDTNGKQPTHPQGGKSTKRPRSRAHRQAPYAHRIPHGKVPSKTPADPLYNCGINRYNQPGLPVLDLDQPIDQDTAQQWFDVSDTVIGSGSYGSVRRVDVRNYEERNAYPVASKCGTKILAIKRSSITTVSRILTALSEDVYHTQVYGRSPPEGRDFFTTPYQMELPDVKFNFDGIRGIPMMTQTLHYWWQQYNQGLQITPPRIQHMYSVQSFAMPPTATSEDIDDVETMNISQFVTHLSWRRYDMNAAASLLGMQYGRAIAYCHNAGVLHCDLHYKNVLVTFDKTVGNALTSSQLKLVDFGFAMEVMNHSVEQLEQLYGINPSIELLAVDMLQMDGGPMPPYMTFQQDSDKYEFYNSSVRGYNSVRSMGDNAFVSAQDAVRIYNEYDAQIGYASDSSARSTIWDARWEKYKQLIQLFDWGGAIQELDELADAQEEELRQNAWRAWLQEERIRQDAHRRARLERDEADRRARLGEIADES